MTRHLPQTWRGPYYLPKARFALIAVRALQKVKYSRDSKLNMLTVDNCVIAQNDYNHYNIYLIMMY